MKRSAKLVDVAHKAKVDIATASRALNKGRGWERLSHACVERVQEAALELGYRPNAAARRLRRPQPNAVGLLLPNEAGSAFTQQLIVSLESALRRAGIHSILLAGEDPLDAALAFAAEGRIDALVAPAFALSPAALAKLHANGIPLVRTHTQPGDQQSASIALDAGAGIRQAVKHLAALGHKRIVWAGYDPAQHNDAARRRGAFFAACADEEVRASEVVIQPSPTGMLSTLITAAEAAFTEQRSVACTGVVCYHDPIALGVLCAARKRGLHVPEDLSVIGFDDTFGEVSDPPLTTISHQPEAISDAAVGVLKDLLGREGEFDGDPISITPELVARQSTTHCTHE